MNVSCLSFSLFLMWQCLWRNRVQESGGLLKIWRRGRQHKNGKGRCQVWGWGMYCAEVLDMFSVAGFNKPFSATKPKQPNSEFSARSHAILNTNYCGKKDSALLCAFWTLYYLQEVVVVENVYAWHLFWFYMLWRVCSAHIYKSSTEKSLLQFWQSDTQNNLTAD